MTTRTLRTTAVLGAACLLAEGALELVHEQGQPLTGLLDHLIELLFAAGLLLTLAGLPLLHARHGATGRRALQLAAAGQGSLGLVALASAARGHDVLGPVFLLGLLLWVAGTAAFAVAAVRAGTVAPRWLPAALPLALVASFAAGNGGLVLLGAAWLLVLALPGARAARTRAVAPVAA
jgi:hypothetical protein